MNRAKLEMLQALASLRADVAGARLSKRQMVVRDLERQDAALREPCEEPQSLPERRALDQYEAWRRKELGKLSLKLARAHADAQPLRERYAHDVARREVIAKLVGKLRK